MFTADSEMVRLVHLSDIHVTAPGCNWRGEDWLNKRMTSWLNLRLLGRGFRFRSAERVLAALREEVEQRLSESRQSNHPFRLIFSGDATALGFPEEVARAAALLHVDRIPGLAVPGNHDYCTRSAMLSGYFERFFAPWQVGKRIGEETYPFAQQVGHLWLVAVNSATANRWAWDARGAVGSAQLARLEELLSHIHGDLRVLVTHYPVALATGQRERRVRQLRDLDRLLDVAERGGVCLWLHGHRHGAYHLARTDVAPFPVICAGSTTQTGLWSYGDYTICGNRLHAQQRVYDPEQDCFSDGRTFELDLSCPEASTVAR